MPEDQHIEWKEPWGRGIEKINKGCVAHDIEPANFNFRMSGLMVTFTANPAHISAGITENTGREAVKRSATAKATAKTRVKILELMKKNSKISIPQVAEILNLSVKGVDWQVNELKKTSLIERIGPANGGYWKVKEIKEE